VVLGLVTFFQISNIFGISSFAYMAVVIIGAILIDQVFNNLINPRVMASALKVHPAFVLIAALVAANLIGVIGVIIAAPLLATAQLVGTYMIRKMLDRDPWPEVEQAPPPPMLVPAWLKKTFRRRKQAVDATPKPARKKPR
jgi:predicted PurR-regulated permease PerM